MNSFRISSQSLTKPSCSFRTSLNIARVASFALFIISCVAAAGKFPTPGLGWTVVALSSTVLISSLILFNHSEGIENNKKGLFLVALQIATFITLGSLGGTGILTARQVGQGMLGTIGVSILLQPIVHCYGK